MTVRFPILLLAVLIPSAIPAKPLDPPTAAARGLHGRVRSEAIYAVRTVDIPGIGPRRVHRLDERILYDGMGRAIEHLLAAGDPAAPWMATYDYDPLLGLAASRVVPVTLDDEAVLLPASEELDSRTLFYTSRRDARGRMVERIARRRDGVPIERTVYLYDRDGELIGDSIFHEGEPVVLRSYLRDVERGMLRSTFVAGGAGAPRLALMEEIAPDGIIERRLEYDGEGSTDTRYARGLPVSSVMVQGDRREEICTEYELDRRGNWIHSWSWRRIESGGKVRWEPGGELVRVLRYG